MGSNSSPRVILRFGPYYLGRADLELNVQVRPLIIKSRGYKRVTYSINWYKLLSNVGCKFSFLPVRFQVSRNGSFLPSTEEEMSLWALAGSLEAIGRFLLCLVRKNSKHRNILPNSVSRTWPNPVSVSFLFCRVEGSDWNLYIRKFQACQRVTPHALPTPHASDFSK